MWLAQEPDAELRTLAQAAAERLGLPLTVVPTGTGKLEQALADLLTPGLKTRSSRSAFQRDSAYSSTTSERTVMPPPVPSSQVPSPGGGQGADDDAEVGPPVAGDPAEGAGVDAPRAVASTSRITSIVRSFGAPVIDPAGNSARSAPTVETSSRSRPRTVETSWCTEG